MRFTTTDRDIVFDPSDITKLEPFGSDPDYDDPWTADPPVGYPHYASLGQYWITGNIVPPSANTISIEATDAVKPEGNNGDETSFVFTLTRNGPLGAATNVDYIVIPALPDQPGDNYRQTVDEDDFRSVWLSFEPPQRVRQF